MPSNAHISLEKSSYKIRQHIKLFTMLLKSAGKIQAHNQFMAMLWDLAMSVQTK